MSKDFTITLLPTSPRAARWFAVFGTLTVWIRSPEPEIVETVDGRRLAYLCDLDLLTADQVQRLAEEMAHKCDCTVDEAIIELHDVGLPLLVGDDAVVAIAHPQRWL